MALSACNHRFLTVTEKGQLLAICDKVREHEYVKVSGVVVCMYMY